VVQKEEAVGDLIKEISSVIIVKGMVTLKGIVDEKKVIITKVLIMLKKVMKSLVIICFLSYEKDENDTKDIWYLDSGCCNHMSGNNKLFSTMDESFKSKIKVGDDKALEVSAKGAMQVHTEEGMKSVKDIYYTPQLKHNLLSVGQLCEKNYKVVFENQQCTIYDKNRGNRVVTFVPMSKNRMFPLMFGEHNNHLVNMAYKEKCWLWHLRYGHLNFHSLKLLISKELVYGLPKVQEKKDICKGCAKGKHAREKFSKGNAWRAQCPLQVFHSNICGPMHTKILGKSSHFITFIDDYS
jgi:hypothetical protein